MSKFNFSSIIIIALMTKYIFVSGGVISGLGKGITAASLGFLLKSAGFEVSLMKADMYLNQDAGTMNPVEHGEVYVTCDGMETDQDLGHYERFLGNGLTKDNYLTAGQVYQTVLNRERHLSYDGNCVQAYYAVPQEIIRRIKRAGKDKDFLIVEFGGTVGEYQNILFFEALRRMKLDLPEQVFLLHVAYVPYPEFLGEMKTKPAQQSVGHLNDLGLSPDIIVCRAKRPLDEPRKKKIALAAALATDRIFSNPDVDTIYRIPQVLEKQNFSKTLSGLVETKIKPDLSSYEDLLKKVDYCQEQETVEVGIVGKYYSSGECSLADAYVSVVESVKHAAWEAGCRVEIVWFDSETIEKEPSKTKNLDQVQALIVPGGFGSRGIEGKITAIEYAREKKLPFLGLCYGMQLATVEFARHVVGLTEAHTSEIAKETKHPIIHLMPEQEKRLLKQDYGATMRLGNWPCRLKKGTRPFACYQKAGWLKGKEPVVQERHRHRYELNNQYREQLCEAGLELAGLTPDDKLVEVISLPEKDHPFFVGTQFHPEFLSRPIKPHPLFLGLIRAGKKLI